MALPAAYLTSLKNLNAILDAVQKAQAPQRFTQKFLEGIGFASTTDRLIISVLKSLRFLNETGEPTSTYHQFLDSTQSQAVLARSIEEAYSDLYQVNKKAHEMTLADVKNKMKTLSQGQYSDAVLQKMASTFKALADHADFEASAVDNDDAPTASDDEPGSDDHPKTVNGRSLEKKATGIGGLVYNINIHLPESRDPAVYDALFKSMHDHLL